MMALVPHQSAGFRPMCIIKHWDASKSITEMTVGSGAPSKRPHGTL